MSSLVLPSLPAAPTPASRRASGWAPVLRLVVGLVLATTAATALPSFGSLDSRASSVLESEARARAQIAQIGLATGGAAFLSVGGGDNVIASRGVLDRIDAALDPAKTTGGLYHVRKAIEELVGYAIVPIVLLALLHALTTGDGAEAKLFTLGTRFFAVLAMLWAYPMWDYVLYRKIAIPIASVLESNVLIGRTMNALKGDANVNMTRDLGNSTSTSLLSDYYQNRLRCVALAGTEGMKTDTQVMKGCGGDGTAFPVEALIAADAALLAGGSVEQKQSLWGRFVNNTVRSWNETVAQFNPAFEQAKAIGSTVLTSDQPLSDLWSMFGDTLAESLVGKLVTLQSYIAAAAIWLAWLYVILARAISFIGAPIAIAWHLWPGNDGRAQKWFQGHAGIVLMPAGLALVLTIFFAILVSVVGTNMAGTGLAGFAVQCALFVGLCGVLLKGGNMTKFMAGDVTTVASDVGKAAFQKSVSIAGSAVKIGGKAAMLAATGGVSGALGAVVGQQRASAILNGAKATMESTRIGRGALSLGQKFSTGVEKRLYNDDGTPSGLLKGVRRAKNVATDSVSAARWLWDSRVKSDQVASPGAAIGAVFGAPIAEARKELAALRKQSAETGTSMSKTTRDNLEQSASNRAERAKARDAHKFQDKLLPGHALSPELQGQVDATVNSSNLEPRHANMTKALIAQALKQGHVLDVAFMVGKDGQASVQMSAESQAAMTEMLATNPGLAEVFLERAKKTFGDNIPMVKAENGAVVVNFAELVRRDTVSANIAATAARGTDVVDHDIYMKELINRLVGADKGSSLATAAEAMPGSIRAQGEEESTEAYQARLTLETQAINRQAFYRMLVAAGRPTFGVGNEQEAAHSAALSNELTKLGWENGATFQKAGGRAAMEQAIREVARDREAGYAAARNQVLHANAKEYGLDLAEYVRTAGSNPVYRAQPGSLFAKHTGKQVGTDSDLRAALVAAKSDPAVAKHQRPGESPADFLTRAETDPDVLASLFLNRLSA